MKLRNQKRFFRNILRLICILIMGTAVVFSGIMLFGMRAPEGNKTLNRSGRVNNDVAALSDTDDVLLPQQGSASNQIYTFLVAGMDKVAKNTDVIMLVKLDITEKSIHILHIPRDTMVAADRNSKKINASYQIGGIELFEQDVASLTGFYVNRYVLFDLQGVEKIINAIGGVDFDVPRNMNYEDPTQNLYIHFKKGPQHLNGEQAVKLARFRSYTNGDIGRISLQQDLLKALAKQALKPENLLKLPELVRLINENVETDIDLSNMLWLANEVKDVQVNAIETHMVPGVASTIDNLSYWLPYKNEFLELINNKFNPLDTPITASDLSIVSYPENTGK